MPCRPSWSLAGIVGIISCGLLLLVYGESHFNLVGFVVVMTASMLSGLRWTITQVLLQGTPGSSGHGASGGPVEVLLQLTPGERCSAPFSWLMHLPVLVPSSGPEKGYNAETPVVHTGASIGMLQVPGGLAV